MAALQVNTETSGTKPRYLRLRFSDGGGRDPHCKNSRHKHYVPYEELSPYERPLRYIPEEED